MVDIRYLYEKVNSKLKEISRSNEIDLKTIEKELTKLRITRFDAKLIAKELENEGIIKLKRR